MLASTICKRRGGAGVLADSEVAQIEAMQEAVAKVVEVDDFAADELSPAAGRARDNATAAATSQPMAAS